MPVDRTSHPARRRGALLVALLASGVGGGPSGCDAGPADAADATLDGGRDSAPLPLDRGLPSALEPEPEPGAEPEPEADAGPDAEPPCVVGSVRCEDEDTFATCLRDRSWGSRDCDPDRVCRNGSCVVPLCAPGAFACVDDGTVERCLPDGSGWQRIPCPEGVPCDDARDCALCAPGESLCLADDTLRQCGDDGVWGPRQFCAAATACTDGACVRESCITRVLLLVDRSGSMGAAWRGVGASISAVLDDHPDVWFGLAAFPATFSGCGLTGEWPQVPIGVRGRRDIVDWLAITEPRGDTPLVRALDQLQRRRDAVFGPGRPGHVVVLSDGRDSCGCLAPGDGCEVDELTAAAEALRATAVQTHVIGYAFDDDPSQIDALAAAGGGPRAQHIPAGDEESLREVFATLVDDLKACR